MFIDSRTLPPETAINVDLCIVGTGPAGISLAREFIGHQWSVALLEGGGLDEHEATQRLSSSAGSSAAPFDAQTVSASRRRQFGGNANRWSISIPGSERGIRYTPLDEVDFERRDWMPNSGWPITKAQLDPYYARAQQACKIGPYTYAGEQWSAKGALPFDLPPEQVRTKMFQFGSGHIFTEDYRREIEQAHNITTYLYANVVEVESNPDATHATSLRVACLNSHEFRVNARYYVLAVGGMEAARILLLSRGTVAQGLGNQHDLVGRYFMDHPLVRGGELVPAKRAIFKSSGLYDIREVGGTAVMGHLALGSNALRHGGALNTSMLLYPRASDYMSLYIKSDRGSRAVESAKTLGSALSRRQVPADLVEHVGRTVVGLDGIVKAAKLHLFALAPSVDKGGWSRMPFNDKRFSLFEVYHQTEQAPDRDNRVTLSDERDSLGRQKLQVHWRWTDFDIQGLIRAQKLFAEALTRAGVGRFELQPVDGLPQILTHSTSHHMGTTRMHESPTQGVVDRDCRVHGVDNLFIASCSVFPTGSYANPTLTIVALALRIADHLKQHDRGVKDVFAGTTQDAAGVLV